MQHHIRHHAMQKILPLKTLQASIPRETSQLLAVGIAERNVGTVQHGLSFPGVVIDSKLQFPPNLASLTGLRGIKLIEEKKLSQSAKDEIEEREAEVGDPEEGKKLLLAMQKIFGSWAKPFFGHQIS